MAIKIERYKGELKVWLRNLIAARIKKMELRIKKKRLLNITYP